MPRTRNERDVLETELPCRPSCRIYRRELAAGQADKTRREWLEWQIRQVEQSSVWREEVTFRSSTPSILYRLLPHIHRNARSGFECPRCHAGTRLALDLGYSEAFMKLTANRREQWKRT